MSDITPETGMFARELNEWRNKRGLSGSDLPRILGTSRQMISDVLARNRAFSAEKALQAVQILNNYQKTAPMTTKAQPQDEGVEQINAAVLKRFSKSGTRAANISRAG